MVLVVLGFAAMASLFVYLAVRGAGGWRNKLDHILLPIGFEHGDSGRDKSALAQRLSIVNPRHQDKRLVMHHYRRAAVDTGFTVHVCDYHFASASGKARGGNWLLVCLVAPALDMPRLSIDSVPTQSGVAARLMRSLADTLDMPGMSRLSCGAPDLDARFHVYAQDAGAVGAVLPVVLAELARSDIGASLDASGDTLVLCSVAMLADRMRQILDSQKLLELIELATRLHRTLSHR